MHRVTAVLWASAEAWWLTNRSGVLEIGITEPGTRSLLRCGPTQSVALSFCEHEIEIVTGKSVHRLGASCDPVNPPSVVVPAPAPETIPWGHIPLGDVEREVLTALAEPWLRDPGYDGPLDSNKAIRSRLGLSPNSFNHALDRMCRKLDDQGVDGVRGDLGELATERRRRLVDHALRHQIITAHDLPTRTPMSPP